MYVGHIFNKKSDKWNATDFTMLSLAMQAELGSDAIEESTLKNYPIDAFFCKESCSIVINDKTQYEAAHRLLDRNDGHNTVFGKWVKTRGEKLGFIDRKTVSFDINEFNDIQRLVNKVLDEMKSLDDVTKSTHMDEFISRIARALYMDFVVDSKDGDNTLKVQDFIMEMEDFISVNNTLKKIDYKDETQSIYLSHIVSIVLGKISR